MSLFGRIYRTFTFGQSHAKAVGCVIDGFPSGFKIDISQIQSQLNRRKPGQSSITTPRKENDIVQCISGLENQVTLGCPLMFLVKNQNIKKADYDRFQNIPRPGHADFTYMTKYGLTASSGGGRSSARETIGRIISGALAKQYLKQKYSVQFSAWVYQIGQERIPKKQNQNFTSKKKNLELINLRERKDFHQIKKQQIFDVLTNKQHKKFKKQGDSVGGIIQGSIYNLPIGLGQPVFDKIQAYLAHAMLSIPATKGFEFGSGFQGVKMKGSQHNDMFVSENQINKSLKQNKIDRLKNQTNIKLKSNNSGGSLGGLSSGQTFEYKVAFKPVSTISKPQKTVNYSGKQQILQGKGRHDPCVLPRAPAIVDNMAAMAIMDLLQLNKLYQ